MREIRDGHCLHCGAPVKVWEYGKSRHYGCLECGREMQEFGEHAEESAIYKKPAKNEKNT